LLTSSSSWSRRSRQRCSSSDVVDAVHRLDWDDEARAASALPDEYGDECASTHRWDSTDDMLDAGEMVAGEEDEAKSAGSK